MESTVWKPTKARVDSALKNNSLSLPRDPSTSLPLNQFERPLVYCSEQEVSSLPDVFTQPNCPFSVNGWSSKSKKQQDAIHEPHLETESVYDREMQSCDALLAEVESLRVEHQTAMGVLEKLHQNQKKLKELINTVSANCKSNYPQIQIEQKCDSFMPFSELSPPERYLQHEGAYVAEEDDHSCITTSSTTESTAEEDPSSSSNHSGSQHISFDESLDDSSVGDPEDAFACPGLEAIESMWDNFSIDSYAPSSTWVSQPLNLGKAEPKPWRPKITIPKPFSMTLRDENKEKKKSKTLLAAEREKLEKEALEQAELNKMFRANPVPATTYLPLYEMINAQRERRRQYVKNNSQKMLKAEERPFSFVEREMARLKAKEEELAERLEKEKEQWSREMFKATPIPQNILDPKIDERIKEQEEYRSIRIRMRALELLANSHLPRNMETKGREYTVGQLRKLRKEEFEKLAFLTAEHSFHPTVTGDIPDHKQAYDNFQRQLSQRKKDENTLTVTQPFNLRTNGRILERKSKVKSAQSGPSVQFTKLKPSASIPSVSASRLKPSTSRSIPLTRSTQLKHQGTLQRLARQHEEEELCERVKREKKDQQAELQKAVSHKSIANDVAFAMEQRREEKLLELRYEIVINH